MISVLIPFRAPAGSHRDRLRAAVLRLWQALPVEVVVRGDGRTAGPWNCAAALNAARDAASNDVMLLMGADHIPPTAAELADVEAKMATLPWMAAWGRTRELTEDATEEALAAIEAGAGREAVDAVADRYAEIPSCMGVFAIRAHAWDDIRGADERFSGWGYEDTAQRLTLRTLYPDGETEAAGAVLAFWHPRPADQWQAAERNRRLYHEYARAAERGRLRHYIDRRS